MTITRLAPAKLNLALHVTDRRANGYHDLDSLVVFADFGDQLAFEGADGLTLQVDGPLADGVPMDDRNLVLRAAALFGPAKGAAISLTKHLPHAAGIGGGSSDAAAALTGLAELWGSELPQDEAILSLGADLPVCMAARPARMRGIGEDLAEVPRLPQMSVVMVNPGVRVPTGQVFGALSELQNPPMSPPVWQDFGSFIHWLAQQRNDLEAPARGIAPEISDVIDALEAEPDCALARMSGSGATCFGVFEQPASAAQAAARLSADHPNWWVQAAGLLAA